MKGIHVTWSESELEFLQQNYTKLSHQQIAEHIGKTTKHVKSKCQRDGLLSRPYRYEVKETFFDTWSADMAWILGFTMSDGCVEYSEEKSRFRLTYCIQSRDVEILNFINLKLETDKPFNIFEGMLNAKYTSKYMTQRLIDLGVSPRKTGHECIPHGMPNEYFYDFLLGYFDGDGSVSILKKRPRFANVYICSSSRQILDDIKDFTELGNVIDVGPYRKVGGDFYYWKVTKQSELKELYSRFYDNGGFRLERKFEVFNQYIKNIS